MKVTVSTTQPKLVDFLPFEHLHKDMEPLQSFLLLLSQVEDRHCSRYLQAARTDSCRDEGLQKLLENLTLTEFNLFSHNSSKKIYNILNSLQRTKRFVLYYLLGPSHLLEKSETEKIQHLPPNRAACLAENSLSKQR